MKKSEKRILSVFLAAAALASFAACDSSSGNNDGGANSAGTADASITDDITTTTEKTEWTGDNIDIADDEGALNTDVDISGKTLKWMGFYDLNPTNDNPERSAEVALFEDTYGAKIEYLATTNDKRFDDLATAIVGGTPPDIFIYEWRTFPYDINKNQYQPVDSLIDWSDPMWADVKTTADKFLWKGEHYIAPLGYAFNDTQVLMYNKTTVQDCALDDPYELYLEGKWDWDAFVDIMKSYVEEEEGHYGISGWWANAFVYTAGDTMVTYDGSKFTNNLRSANIERAQLVLEDIWKSDLVLRGWVNPDAAFNSDNSALFYSMGTWAYDGAAKSMPGDVIQIVPFPRNPDDNKYYVSNKVNAYMWVKGSDNGDVVKAWFDCNRLVNYEEKYTEVTKQKFLENAQGWTSEMYDIAMDFYDESKFVQAYDYGYGLSSYMGDEVMGILYEGIVNEQFESWVQGREDLMLVVDSEIEQYNQ